MSSLDELTVVVVTFNSAHCVDALASGLAGVRHLVVVDNASDDDTVERVAAAMPHAHLLKNPRNLGFGAANNRALAAVRTRCALLLNPDCEPTGAVLESLLEAAAKFPDAAIVAPQLLRADGSPEISYRWPAPKWRSVGPAAEAPCCVGFVSGAVMLLNLDALGDDGFFDETFFLYYEDEDLCLRTFAAGQQIVVVPDVRIVHRSRGSVRGPSRLRSEFVRGYHHAQSKLVFEHRYFGAARASRLRRTTLLLALLTIVPRALLPQPRYLMRLAGRIAGLWRAAPIAGAAPIRPAGLPNSGDRAVRRAQPGAGA